MGGAFVTVDKLEDWDWLRVLESGLARLRDDVRSSNRVWYAKGPVACLELVEALDDREFERSICVCAHNQSNDIGNDKNGFWFVYNEPLRPEATKSENSRKGLMHVT